MFHSIFEDKIFKQLKVVTNLVRHIRNNIEIHPTHLVNNLTEFGTQFGIFRIIGLGFVVYLSI